MGMETQEVGIKANLTIRLKSANEKLDEVMVVAYGTAKKSSFTGAAEVIKNEQLEKMNVVSVTKALEGTSPGLQVMGGTGQPGAGGYSPYPWYRFAVILFCSFVCVERSCF